MTTGILVISVLAAIGIAAFFQWSLILWSSLLISILLVFSIISFTPSVIILWAFILPLVAILNITALRQRLITRFLQKQFVARMPQLTSVEVAALKAGDVWWEKEIFSGNPHWSTLFSYPKNSLTEDEQDFINTKVKILCRMLNETTIHEEQDLPEKVWRYIKQEKFFGMIIEKKYGGLEFSALAHSTVIMMIASRSYTTAVNIMVPNSLGPAEFIKHYGTEEQKQHYLPMLAAGDEVPCFALTSPNAGSDAASITDTGVVCFDTFDGKKTLGLRLNWNKRYITLAPRATLIALAVRTEDPDHLLGKKTNLGISLCLVSTHLRGVTIGKRHHPLNVAFINGPTSGHDVFIPLENIIGGASRIGHGWEMIVTSLSVGRAISLPAVSTGTAKMCYALSSAYARVREQFSIPIGELEGVQEALGRIACHTYICEATRLFTLSAADSGIKPSIASAITKYHLTELNRSVINDAMDIHAGRGIMMGEKNYLGQYYFSAPINITVEGANILTRNLIIFGQGVLRCHPFAADEMVAVNDADSNLGAEKFDSLIFKHIAWVIGNAVRAFYYAVTGSRFISVPDKGVKNYLQKMTRLSAALALVSDVAMMVLGGELKRKERLSARLGDVLSYLYLASAAVKYYDNEGQQVEDKPFLHYVVTFCLFKSQQSLINFLDNLKPRWVSWTLKGIIFLWRSPYKEPSDKDCSQIVSAMFKLDSVRERLLSNIYRSDDSYDAANKMQLTFELMTKTSKSYQTFKKARKAGDFGKGLRVEEELNLAEKNGILTSEQVKDILNMLSLQKEVIQVDEF